MKSHNWEDPNNQFAAPNAIQSPSSVVSHLPGIKNILVPVDLSRSSQAALRYAHSFAEKFGGRIIVVYAVAHDELMVNPEELRDEIIRLTAINSARVSTLLMRPGLMSPRQICDDARDEQADVIVLSADYHLQPSQFLQSSPLEKLIFQAHCPVMVVSDKVGLPTFN